MVFVFLALSTGRRLVFIDRNVKPSLRPLYVGVITSMYVSMFVSVEGNKCHVDHSETISYVTKAQTVERILEKIIFKISLYINKKPNMVQVARSPLIGCTCISHVYSSKGKG